MNVLIIAEGREWPVAMAITIREPLHIGAIWFKGRMHLLTVWVIVSATLAICYSYYVTVVISMNSIPYNYQPSSMPTLLT